MHYGAKTKYPKEEEQERLVLNRIKELQEEDFINKRRTEEFSDENNISTKRLLTKIIHKLAWICLLIIIITAIYVFSCSGDIVQYETNFKVFKLVAFAATILYFVLGIATQILQDRLN